MWVSNVGGIYLSSNVVRVFNSLLQMFRIFHSAIRFSVFLHFGFLLGFDAVHIVVIFAHPSANYCVLLWLLGQLAVCWLLAVPKTTYNCDLQHSYAVAMPKKVPSLMHGTCSTNGSSPNFDATLESIAGEVLCLRKKVGEPINLEEGGL